MTHTASTTDYSVLETARELGAGVHSAFIDGRWVEPTGGRVWSHRHPATGENDFDLAVSSPEDVDRAVRAARSAFDDGPWGRLRARERKLLLQPLAAMVREHEVELARLQSIDNGLPITVGSGFRFSGRFAADLFDYHTGWIDKMDAVVPPVYSELADVQMLTLKEPVGVVAAVTPFNAPVMQFAQKIAPALASGCTVVIKPSEYASNVAELYMRLIERLDLPPGVINFLPGDASTSGALFRHPGVDKIAFTGRREVGEVIMNAAAKDIKRVQLELGGKSPSLVFPDVEDVAATARYAMSVVSMGLSGQLCSTQTRAVVHRSIYDEFLAHATEQINDVRLGDSFDPSVTSAPLLNEAAVERVERLVRGAESEGARLVAGGERLAPHPGGTWFAPTIFADVAPSMEIARTEVFGPVLSVLPFDDEDEAIRIANDSEYGLSAGVYTRDISRALRVARSIRSGTVGINSLFVYPPTAPFGGFKSSGLGREGGREGFEDYLETKTISIPLS